MGLDWFPLLNSIRIAAASTVVVFFLGIGLANLVARAPRVVKGVLDVVLTLPLVLPPTVVGYLLLLALAPARPLGAWVLEVWGLKLTMTWYSAIAATVVVSFPLLYRTARGAFEAFDQDLAAAARTLGKSEAWIFWRVKMPCCRQGIVAGGVLAFARALGEYGATSMVAGYIPGHTATISTTVYQLWRTGDDALAFKWVLVNLAISAVVLLAMNLFEGRSRVAVAGAAAAAEAAPTFRAEAPTFRAEASTFRAHTYNLGAQTGQDCTQGRGIEAPTFRAHTYNLGAQTGQDCTPGRGIEEKGRGAAEKGRAPSGDAAPSPSGDAAPSPVDDATPSPAPATPALSVDIKRRLASFGLDVAFELDRPDEVMALLGPSGCGKSMTLKCIAGIAEPDEGRIVLGDRVLFDSEKGIDLAPQQRRVGYLFQQYALFPHMTVLQNVMVGAVGSTRAEREARARQELAALRLEGLEDLRPRQLSGGQQQRCAMARILASEPELILLDEPFSALDGYLRWQLELELTDVLRGFSGGAVYVSHNRDEVYRMCSTVSVVSRGKSDPKVGVKELFARPQSLAAALISGCKNVSAAEVVGSGLLRCLDWGVTLACDPAADLAGVTHTGIRAHYFKVLPAGTQVPNGIACTVDRVIDNTFSTIVMLRTPVGGLLRYECGKDAWAALGAPAQLVLAVAPHDVMPLAGKEGGG